MFSRRSIESRALREAQKAFVKKGRQFGRDSRSSGQMSPEVKGLLIGLFVFGIFGGFLFPWVIWTNHRVEQMLTWPKIQATVVETYTAYSYRRYTGSGYKQEIRYRYVVNGREFTGDRVSYGDAAPIWPTRSQAEANLPKIGSVVTIRHNPTAPEDSVIHVLRTSSGMTTYMLWVTGIAGVVSGVLAVISGAALFRRRK